MKTLLLIAFILFASCKGSLAPAEELKSDQITTLQVQNEHYFYPVTEFADGSLWETNIMYYKDGKLAFTENVEPVLIGAKSIFTIKEGYDSFRFSFQLLPKKSIYYVKAVAHCRYVTGYVPFVKGSSTLVIIRGDVQYEVL